MHEIVKIILSILADFAIDFLHRCKKSANKLKNIKRKPPKK